MSEKKEIKITAAKGRPMLTWVGKRPLRSVTAFPAQHVETFSPADVGAIHESPVWKDWPAAYPQGGLLFHGDNKEVLGHLLANGFRGKVKLIYIDPPFDSGADYVRKVQLRGGAATAKIDGESYALGEQIQYTDIWANDNYLQFMYERLMLLRELLAEDGSIYLHCDWRKNYMIRHIMDEVFGIENFKNEISWIRTSSHNDTTDRFTRVKDTIFFYSKGSKIVFNQKYKEYNKSYLDAEWNELPNGRYWKCENMLDPRGSMKEYDFHGTIARWRTSLEKMEQLWNDQQTDVPNSHGRIKLGKDGTPTKRCRIIFLDELPGVLLTDHWDDIAYVAGGASEQLPYPTQKPQGLLTRIIETSSNPGDLVLDCFIGSGTTAAVAQKLGRRWIGCDINKGAIQTTAKRLQTIMAEQAGAIHESPLRLPGMENDKEAAPAPAQLSFTVWRVNDYDLKIQRNEAIQLACEHVGVERLPADSFFDGKLGKKLVKIVPFEHPLSPLDLEELKRELEARPELENTVVFVCLGIELAARTWIEDWNRLRKGAETVNKIEVIELRTDEKYGNFIQHEPAAAQVAIARDGDRIRVKIEDFISPTILKRLDMDTPLFKAKIADWRSQIDCVMIDTTYDGAVFNVELADVPARKTDLIDGAYTLPAPEGKTTVAVKIIDMLGEEVLVTEGV